MFDPLFPDATRRRSFPLLPVAGILLFLLLLILLVRIPNCRSDTHPALPEFKTTEPPPARLHPDLHTPVRPPLDRFPRDAKRPAKRETECADPINLDSFSAARDLVYIDDPRVWWESDHDEAERDIEDDHSMHAAMELPFRRLVNLAARQCPEFQLRVQECYRPAGIHSAKSLHCEGRALDLTFGRDNEPLPAAQRNDAYEKLAILCWQAGFDWVYYENSRGTGPHIHVSVRRDAPRLQPPPDGLPLPSMTSGHPNPGISVPVPQPDGTETASNRHE